MGCLFCNVETREYNRFARMKITARQCFGSLCGSRGRVRPRTFYFYAVILRLLPVALVTVALNAAAENNPVPTHRHYTVQRSIEHPRIDGKADDGVWSTVTSTESFTQFEPKPGEPSEHHTEVKVVYDDQALYVLAK